MVRQRDDSPQQCCIQEVFNVPGTVEQCEHVLSHLVRIIRASAAQLNKPSKTRRVPRCSGITMYLFDYSHFFHRGVKSAELSSVVAWALSECGCPEMQARKQCMHIFTVLAPLSASELSSDTVSIENTA